MQIIKINPKYESLRPVVEAIASGGVPADRRMVYDGPRNKVYALSRGGVELNIKAFHRPRWPNSIIYGKLRRSKAERSYRHALSLLELGIGTPEPVAYIETFEGMSMRETYYISLQVEASTVRDWERLPHADELVEALARDMARLHAAGVLHRDFSPGNVLYTRSPRGEYRFYYVDLNRMELGVHDRALLMRNFRCIHLSLDQTLRLARAYARVTGQDEVKIVYEATRQVMRYRSEKARIAALKSLIGHGKKS